MMDFVNTLLAFLFSRLLATFVDSDPRRDKRRFLARPRPRRTPPKLPHEVILHILDCWTPSSDWGAHDARQAHRERLAFYDSCALVHPSWNAHARKRQREKVFVSGKLQRFLQRMDRCEQVAKGVRELTVDTTEEGGAWFAQEYLKEVLKRCPNLWSLSLVGLKWVQVEELLSAPKLERLHLAGTNVDVSSPPPGSLHYLTQLSLDDSTFTTQHGSNARTSDAVDRLLPNVVALELANAGEDFSVSFPKLRYLSFRDAPLPNVIEQLFTRPFFVHAPSPPSSFDWSSSSSSSSSPSSSSYFDHKPVIPAPPSVPVPTYHRHLTLLSTPPALLFTQRHLDLPPFLNLSLSHLRLEPLPFHYPPLLSLSGEDVTGEMTACGLRLVLAGLVSAKPSKAFERLETMSIVSSMVVDEELADAVSELGPHAAYHGVKVRYHEEGETEAEVRTKGSSRANAAEWKATAFWSEVYRLEGSSVLRA